MFPNLDCDRDIAQIAAALKSNFGFKDEDIISLTSVPSPGHTTRVAILSALYKLISETQAGDIVYVHFSGHGSQVLDPDKPDGLDSTIVPADYRVNQSSEQTSNEISGKTIGQILLKLQQKRPAQITLSFDCCHSGDISRGAAKKRGLTYMDYVDWFKRTYHRDPPLPVSSKAETGGQSNSALDDLTGKGYVVISACANDEAASETSDSDPAMGRLSKVLAHVFAAATNETTYRQVWDEVKANFEAKYSDQHPQFAGQLDTFLLGGVAPAPSNAIPIHLGGATGFVLDSGSLQDVTIGSTYDIYSKNALKFDETTKIGEGVVTRISPTNAALTIKPAPSNPEVFAAAQAIEKVHRYAISPLLFDAASVRAVVPQLASTILTDVKALSMVATNIPAGRTPDIKLASAHATAANLRGAANVVLERGDTGYALDTIPVDNDLPSRLSVDLDREARYRYVLGLNPPASSRTGSIAVGIRIVPALPTSDQFGDQVWAPDDSGKYVPQKIGDYFMIEVRNSGKVKSHVSILDLESSDAITVQWPAENAGEYDNLLLPNQDWTPVWQTGNVAAPCVWQFDTADPGEIYKAFATDTPTDFRGLQRGESRGPGSPFDQLLAPGLTGARGSSEVLAPTLWDSAQTVVAVSDSGAGKQ